MHARRAMRVSVLLLALLSVATLAPAQQQAEEWDVTQPRGKTRSIDFTTREGTWMSVDISPDGRWVVFDLLSHIYRVPAAGGEAQCLTQNSGIALNYQPRFSPDGTHIVFISDRKGQNNLWLMDADGSNPRPVFTDKDARVWEPAWTPDGNYLIVRRQDLKQRGLFGTSLWMYHRDGGQGVELIGSDTNAHWPSVSPDGRYVYFQVGLCPGAPTYGRMDPLLGCYQIRRLELASGEIIDITSGQAMQQYRGSSGGALAPEVSPDGRWLAFARRIPDGTISYKGHKFGPRNALWLRDLQTGAERVLMDPIESDIAEQFPILRVLPGYAWARDSKSLVISQGGQLRRVWVETGQVDTIPFTARVQRTLSEMAWAPFRISDGSFDVRFIRWPTASPDGRRLAFQAVGKIWVMDLPNGAPRRLTSDSFAPFEFAPAWSPDGRWLAFTSWGDKERGHLWRVAAAGPAAGGAGGSPERLTQEAGEYANPAWSPDGRSVVVARGSGATARGRAMETNPWYELVRVPATGGPAEFIVRVLAPSARGQLPQVSFGPEGRLYYPEQKPAGPGPFAGPAATELLSVRPDGSDKRVHLKFPYADEVAVSPDGRWVSFQEGDNVYLVPLPPAGTGANIPQVDKRKGQFPVKQLTREGGLFPHWRNARTLEYGSANKYFAYDVETQQATTTEIKLSVPRALPTGSLALTNARLITLDNRRVIERGTLLIRGARIACLGTCDTRGVDRVIDLRGKTIIPGFVDLHAHHHREHQGILPQRDFEQAIYLAYGVTTTLDPAAWSGNAFPTAELIEAGAVIGPRIYTTADPIYAGDGPRMNEITSYEVAEAEVRRVVSWGATAIKQYLQPRREQRQWLLEAARKVGVMVTAEGSMDLDHKISMVLDGHTGFEHPTPYVPLYSDVAKFFGQARTVYSPTMIVGGVGPWNEEFFFQESDTWRDEKMRRWLPWRQLVPHARRRTLRPATDYSYPLIAQGLADIIAEGGYGAIGSHGQQHGVASHWETWMTAAGTGSMGALEVASLHGAHFIGIEQDVGSLAVGKLADLIVLNSNPLDNIRHTLDMLYVMKAGRLHDAATLDEVWPERRPFGDYYWVEPDALRTDDRPVTYWNRKP